MAWVQQEHCQKNDNNSRKNMIIIRFSSLDSSFVFLASIWPLMPVIRGPMPVFGRPGWS